MLNIVLIGDSGVGKTSICEQYINNSFTHHSSETQFVSIYEKIVNIKDCSIKLSIKDTAGMECYKNNINKFYAKATCAIIVYDLSEHVSFDNLQ